MKTKINLEAVRELLDNASSRDMLMLSALIDGTPFHKIPEFSRVRKSTLQSWRKTIIRKIKKEIREAELVKEFGISRRG